MINVIFAAPRKDLGSINRVMTISPWSKVDEEGGPLTKIKLQEQPILEFSKANKERKIQPHDDALIVTMRITGFNVKRVTREVGPRLCIQIYSKAWD